MTYKENVDSHTIIGGNINTPLSILDRLMRHKINRAIQDLNSDLNQVDLINIYRNPTANTKNVHSSQHHISPTLKLTT